MNHNTVIQEDVWTVAQRLQRMIVFAESHGNTCRLHASEEAVVLHTDGIDRDNNPIVIYDVCRNMRELKDALGY